MATSQLPEPETETTSMIVSPSSLASASKRKREDNSAAEVEPDTPSKKSKKHHVVWADWLRDAMEVLKDDDILKMAMSQPIESCLSARDNGAGKIEHDISNSDTVEASIKHGRYEDIPNLVTDMTTALHSIKERRQTGGELASPVLDGQADKSAVISANMQSRLEELLSSEIALKRLDPDFQDGDHDREQASDSKSTESVKNADFNTGPVGRAVLTLLGGEKSARQMFASPCGGKENLLELEDEVLPPGISSTKVLPIHTETSKMKQVPTLGTVFGSNANAKSLAMPRNGLSSKLNAARTGPVHWINRADLIDVAASNNPRDSYYKQPLTPGHWLKYETSSTSDDLGLGRRDMDRSTNAFEPTSALTEEASALQAQSRNEDLFTSVFSSFAPTHDDANATISTDIRNQLWWTRKGQEEYLDLIAHRSDVPFTEFAILEQEQDQEEDGEIDDSLIQSGLDSWQEIHVPQDFSDLSESKEQTLNDVEVKSMGNDLAAINNLLEAVNSEQRIRAQAASLKPFGQEKQVNGAGASIDGPSSSEMVTFTSLQDCLARTVSQQAPHITSRINGHADGPLIASRKIRQAGKTHRGTFEQDELTVKLKQAALMHANVPVMPPASNVSYNYPPNMPRQSRALSQTAYGINGTPSHTNLLPRQMETGTYSPRAAPAQHTFRSDLSARAASLATGASTSTPRSSYTTQYQQHRYTPGNTSDRMGTNSTPHTQYVPGHGLNGPSQYSQYGPSYRGGTGTSNISTPGSAAMPQMRGPSTLSSAAPYPPGSAQHRLNGPSSTVQTSAGRGYSTGRFSVVPCDSPSNYSYSNNNNNNNNNNQAQGNVSRPAANVPAMASAAPSSASPAPPAPLAPPSTPATGPVSTSTVPTASQVAGLS